MMKLAASEAVLEWSIPGNDHNVARAVYNDRCEALGIKRSYLAIYGGSSTWSRDEFGDILGAMPVALASENNLPLPTPLKMHVAFGRWLQTESVFYRRAPGPDSEVPDTWSTIPKSWRR